MQRSCCYACVDTGSIGVVESCGAFKKMAHPGLVLLNPCTDNVAGYLSLRIQQLDVAVETKTLDNVFVTIVVSTQYVTMRAKPYEAFYKLTDSRAQIRSYVFDVVRSTVPKIKLDDVFLEKEAIAHSVKEELTKSMTEFGWQIIETLVTDIAPDAKVKAAMNEINAAQRLRVAAADKAEAEKIMVVKQAEADAEAKYLAGTGIARQRQTIVNGLCDGIEGFTDRIDGVSPQTVMDMMMVTQYFDTLNAVGKQPNSNVVYLSCDKQDGNGGLRKSLLEAGAMTSST